MNQTLINPVGSTYVYSDLRCSITSLLLLLRLLSFITIMYIVGALARTYGYVQLSDLYPGCYDASLGTSGPNDQCFFEAYVRMYVWGALNLTNTQFLPPRALWPLAAPCENDTTYRHIVSQGTVSDGNAYAMGGIAGHAGSFSNALDLSVRFSFERFPAHENADTHGALNVAWC